MKKIFILIALLSCSLSGFSQSVTILPTSTLGGAGSSQWTTSGNNIRYGDGINNNVGIGTTNPIYPLVLRQNDGMNDQPVFQIERASNRTPHQAFVKFGGTTSTPAAITAGEMGLINFGGSTSTGFGSWGFGASIRAVAKGTFSQTSTPGQLEFATTPLNSGSGLLTRMTLDENGRVGINTTSPAGVLDLRYPAGATYGVTNPMLNILGQGGNAVFVRYANTTAGSWSIVQDATPGFDLAGTNIRWRWFDNGNPSLGTTMFEWANSSFNVTGALSTSGNATVAGNATVTGTSTLASRVTIGSSTATTAGVEIRSSTSNLTNPDIYFKGTTNVLRYGNNVDGASITQATVSNNTPNNASIIWNHNTDTNAGVFSVTEMMKLEGDGDLTVSGFTKLGGSAADVPAIKTKILTGNIAAASSQTTSVAHGLTWNKIVDVKVLVSGLGNITVAENFVDLTTTGPTTGPRTGYQFSTFTDPTNIYITRSSSNSASITPVPGLFPTYRILITYIP